MPRLVNKPPQYSEHKPSGQAKVRFNGKTTYLGKYGSQESKERYAAFIAAIPKPDEHPVLAEPVPGAAMTVGERVLRYYQHALTYYARDGVPTGEHVVIRSSLRPLTKRFDSLPVREFGPKKLKTIREDMIALGWSRQYINKATSIVKRCFTWAASEEFVPPEIAMGLKTVPGLQKNRTAAREKAPIGPVDDDQIDAVLPMVSELVSDVCRLMRLTGMRPGEVLAMTAAQIDRTDPSCWKYAPTHHKTIHKGHSRVIFLGTRAQEIVLPRILRSGSGELFPMTRAALRRAIHRGCRRAYPHPTLSGIAKDKLTAAERAELKGWIKAHSWHPNQIRHTVATNVRANYGLEAAQVLLGHSKADTTQVYAERDMTKAADVARRIG